MIRIFLGQVGSGKTACAVREMILNPPKRVTFSNINTKYVKNFQQINAGMIVKKVLTGTKKSGEHVYKYEFNKEFWQQAVEKYKNINVILDEVHTILSSRRAMSKQTQCVLDFLALIRRVVGQSESGGGSLTLISQLERRIDVIAKEMCNHVRYHVCHYRKLCMNCNLPWSEHNEMPELMWECPRCGSLNIKKYDHRIEVMQFQSMDLFIRWKYLGVPLKKTAYRHYYINDIEKFFPFYNTLQWDSLLTEL